MLIEIYSDVVCPWCYIGERRLERALAQRPDLEVELRWQPFQLRPEMPKEGVPWGEFAERKFGGLERAESIFANVTAVGASEGLEFNFGNIASAPNTADAHRLILFAREHGLQWEAVRTLFAAYFNRGLNIGDREQLAALAGEIGLDSEEVRAYLQSDKNVGEVSDSQEEAKNNSIEGVPFYIFDRRYALSGAQPSEVFLEALDAAAGQVAYAG